MGKDRLTAFSDGVIAITLGQKIESVERWGIVPDRRSLGKRWTNYTHHPGGIAALTLARKL
jgi:hypothetical protein